MEVKDIINAHKNFGTTEEDIINRLNYSNVLENIVVAPWWSVSIFEKFSDKIIQTGEKTYSVFGKGFEFTFIEIKNIGAPAIIESVLPLSLIKCKNIIFIGSVGSLTQNIKIGDLVIPKYSINGVGACRFLESNLEDDFEEKFYPDEDLNLKLVSMIEENFPTLKVHQTVNYSVDTIFAQFPHINHFIELGAETIEMETSALFKCGEISNIKTTALLCVSDNSLKNKSLYSGRNESERMIKKEIKDNVIPQIIIKMLQTNN